MMDVHPVPEFTIGRDPEWLDVDLLGEGAQELLGESVFATLQTAAAGRPGARLLMARGLYAPSPDGAPLSVGLVVALADRDAEVSQRPLSEAAPPSTADVSAIELPAGTGLRVRDLVAGVEVGGQVLPILRVQYLLQTPDGLLMIELSTARAAESEIWERLFDAMAATARLD